MSPIGLFWLGLLGGGDSAIAPLVGPASASAPAIRLWLNNNRQFREGDRARVQVETRDDGFLVVLHHDTEGRLRVLFPIDPRDDNRVEGGHRYEIRGRGDRDESFVTARDGNGLVYAAVSPDPFRFDEFEIDGRWDLGRLEVRNSSDPEADITELLDRMVGETGFDYDLLEYRVYDYRDRYIYSGGWYPRPYGYWDDYYCDWWYRPSLFGCRPGFYLGFGYHPYRYGYYSSFYYPYYPYYRHRYYGGYTGYNRRWPVVVGRPRRYTIVRGGSNDFGRRGGSYTGSFPRSRGEGVYRPRSGERRGRPAYDDRDRRPSGGDVSRPSGDRGDRGARPSGGRPSGDRPSRPRGRRSTSGNNLEGINWERDRTRSRLPVTIDEPSRSSRDSRSAIEPRSERRPAADFPRARRSESSDAPRIERSSPREFEGRRSIERPRNDPPPRVDRAPRMERPAPRSEPPRQVARPAPRSEPRSMGRRGGGGGGDSRPRGGRGGARPRGRR